jgi:hypothetical protein
MRQVEGLLRLAPTLHKRIALMISMAVERARLCQAREAEAPFARLSVISLLVSLAFTIQTPS